MGGPDMRSLKTVLILIGCSIQLTQAAFLKCYNGTMENAQTTPLVSPLPLINNGSCINKDLNTVMYIHGFNGNSTKSDTVAIITAYLAKGGSNVLLLDWAEEASEANMGLAFGYMHAVSNVYKVGTILGVSLNMLGDNGLDLNRTHLVGHSLGAQLVGVAGNVCRSDEGPKLKRITGLDPAGPLFCDSSLCTKSLNKNCAKFVDIVHTDSGVYGIRESVGTVDFYPNYNPVKVIQPGCPLINITTQDTFCNHVRSVAYFRESIFNGTSFPASGQSNYYAWILNNGTTDRVEYLGEYVSPDASGNFYLVTNAQSLYGKGNNGLSPTIAPIKNPLG